MKNRFSIFLMPATMLLLGALVLSVGAQTKDFTRYVNPFVGTGGHGHTFPGATVPHGAVQLSPDTRVENWDGSSGYHYSDREIYGFSHTHLSGTGIPDYCDVLLMPTVGEANFDKTKTTFSHSNEKAEAGYYSVKMDNGVTAELTATARAAFHRYTFSENVDANVLLDLVWRDKTLMSSLKIEGNRIEGYRRSSSWAKDQVVYFSAEFSERFAAPYFAPTDTIKHVSRMRVDNVLGNEIKAIFPFGKPKNRQLFVKVGISAVSVEGARANLRAEIPGWNFEKVRRDAKAAWNKELSQIEVSGGSEAQLTNFYTALYHTKIQPNVFQDVNGNYLGLDKKIHNINENRHPKSKIENSKSNYTIFSLWDTFRAAHPLYTIIDERRTAEFINTFIRQYEQGGRLPVWELAANETDTMIGYHAVSVIADAMAKNIKGFDYERAFQAAKHSAELDHFGLAAYKRRGYISVEDENESVSKTLEYAYNDWCIAQMARLLNRAADYEKYIKRARFYENLFDRNTGFMRAKKNGGFVEPFAPAEVTFNFTEGNSFVYSFFVPHDISHLIELHGGSENFIKKLDELFTTGAKLSGREQPDITGLIGQYAHGNEPSHHIAYLYNYAGAPWKTQFYARKILDEFYKPTPDGLIGNEDCGQMSAWYVLSALGFYPVNPGQAVYAVGAPIFREAKIHLENGKTFTIRAANVSDRNIYVKTARLNGKDLHRSFFTHDELKNGGTLEFEMTSAPVKDWFTSAPVSKIEAQTAPVPTITARRVFRERTTVEMSAPDLSARIFYTLDGSPPDEKSKPYAAPFGVNDSATVRAVAISETGAKSFPVEAKTNRLPHDWTVRIESKYNRQYTGGGDAGLIDGIRGSLNFAGGEWQGYQAQDFAATVDLGKQATIKRLGGGFLQNARSWIWMPTRVEFETSLDGENFRKVAEIVTDIAPDDMTERTKDYFQTIAPTAARFVRVKAFNLGKIPAWHSGAGNDAFIFIDEIIIE